MRGGLLGQTEQCARAEIRFPVMEESCDDARVPIGTAGVAVACDQLEQTIDVGVANRGQIEPVERCRHNIRVT